MAEEVADDVVAVKDRAAGGMLQQEPLHGANIGTRMRGKQSQRMGGSGDVRSHEQDATEFAPAATTTRLPREPHVTTQARRVDGVRVVGRSEHGP